MHAGQCLLLSLPGTTELEQYSVTQIWQLPFFFSPHDSEKLNLVLSSFNFHSKLIISFKLDLHCFLLSVEVMLSKGEG